MYIVSYDDDKHYTCDCTRRKALPKLFSQTTMKIQVQFLLLPLNELNSIALSVSMDQTHWIHVSGIPLFAARSVIKDMTGGTQTCQVTDIVSSPYDCDPELITVRDKN